MSEPARLLGLPPLVDQRSRILVLGSFPSVKSLESGRYYGNPLNHFWKLLSLARNSPPAAWEDYPALVEWALAEGLAIWDTIAECQRPGSLDVAIRQARSNDIASFIRQWPQIRRIILNGGSAYRIFQRQIAASLEGLGIEVFPLPSSSPIPSRDYRRLTDKLPLWSAALDLETLPK